MGVRALRKPPLTSSSAPCPILAAPVALITCAGHSLVATHHGIIGICDGIDLLLELFHLGSKLGPIFHELLRCRVIPKDVGSVFSIIVFYPCPWVVDMAPPPSPK